MIMCVDDPLPYLNLTTRYLDRRSLTDLNIVHVCIAVLDEFAGLLSEEKYSVEDFAVWVDDIIAKCFKTVQLNLIYCCVFRFLHYQLEVC